MSGGVRVYARIRPCGEEERCADVVGNQVLLHGGGENIFAFDAVMDESATQAEVFATVAEPLVQSFLRGNPATVMTYGQTCSGKTFTLLGRPAEAEQRGVLPRLSELLFSEGCTLCVSFLEIYNEKLRDLLVLSTRVKIRERAGMVCLPELTVEEVSTPTAFAELLGRALAARAVGATAMNEVSSRSHFVCLLRKRGFEHWLSVVDLAGSEKLNRTLATGRAAEEAKNINKSLTELGKVVFALSEPGTSFINFRNSKLTRLLQSSLAGGACTAMVINVSPATINYAETLSSLRFGARAKRLKLLPIASISTVISPEAARAGLLARDREITELRDQLDRLRPFSARSLADTIGQNEGVRSAESMARKALHSLEAVAEALGRAEFVVDRMKNCLQPARKENKSPRFLSSAGTLSTFNEEKQISCEASIEQLSAFALTAGSGPDETLLARLHQTETELAAERQQSQQLRKENLYLTQLLSQLGLAARAFRDRLLGPGAWPFVNAE